MADMMATTPMYTRETISQPAAGGQTNVEVQLERILCQLAISDSKIEYRLSFEYSGIFHVFY
jgi:hypothetical protein